MRFFLNQPNNIIFAHHVIAINKNHYSTESFVSKKTSSKNTSSKKPVSRKSAKKSTHKKPHKATSAEEVETKEGLQYHLKIKLIP